MSEPDTTAETFADYDEATDTLYVGFDQSKISDFAAGEKDISVSLRMRKDKVIGFLIHDPIGQLGGIYGIN